MCKILSVLLWVFSSGKVGRWFIVEKLCWKEYFRKNRFMEKEGGVIRMRNIAECFLKAEKCDRCHKPLGIRIMSRMNKDVLCDKCFMLEKKHPLYKEAASAGLREIKKGNMNYGGLFAGQKYPFANQMLKINFAKCSIEDCFIERELLCIYDDGIDKLYFCPNHLLMYVTKLIKTQALLKYPSDFDGGKCEICEKDALYFKDIDTKYLLCRKHFTKLIKRTLEPNEHRKLYILKGNAFAIHEDFY